MSFIRVFLLSMAFLFGLISLSFSGESNLPVKTIHLGAKTIKVEIALTESERSRGLGGRASLAKDRGMLFIFAREQILSFWMKDTLIPLDIAFIDKSGKILEITTMAVEKFGTPIGDYKTYKSKAPARYALEMNIGWFEKNNISKGMVIKELVPSSWK